MAWMRDVMRVVCNESRKKSRVNLIRSLVELHEEPYSWKTLIFSLFSPNQSINVAYVHDVFMHSSKEVSLLVDILVYASL